MRLFVLFAMGLGILPVAALADPFEPYTVRVERDRAAVRSGPGTEFYATDHLDRSTTVEVYRRDADGWLAIRPPEGSHSWLERRYAKLSDRRDVASVAGTEAVSWVGSGPVKVANHKWQVRLRNGESVQVLGEDRFRLVEDGEVTAVLKIAPPAGEFRWIHEDEVAEAGRPTSRLAEHAIPSRPGDGWRSNAPQVAEPSRVELNAGSAAGRLESSPLSGLDYTEGALGDINLELSLLVCHAASTWQLQPLRERTLKLIRDGKSAVERGRARLLLERIEEFTDLQQRQAQVASGRVALASAVSPGSEAPAVAESLDSANMGSGLDADLATGNYDGVGWLVPVHSSKRVAPPFALMDDEGKVLQLVSPAPGLNLHRYVRQRVGIIGQRGRSATFNRSHLTAHRVIKLDRHRR